MPPMDIDYRLALPEDIAACVDLRGRTRENAVPPERLAALGVTVASWSAQVREGELVGHVAWPVSYTHLTLPTICSV